MHKTPLLLRLLYCIVLYCITLKYMILCGSTNVNNLISNPTHSYIHSFIPSLLDCINQLVSIYLSIYLPSPHYSSNNNPF